MLHVWSNTMQQRKRVLFEIIWQQCSGLGGGMLCVHSTMTDCPTAVLSVCKTLLSRQLLAPVR